jgi:lipopolysaccharide heptosyltransferase II
MVKSLLKKILFWPTSPFITRLIGDRFFHLEGKRHCNMDISLSQVKRILVVRLDQIGDVVMTTPFLRELRRNLPDAWISLVVSPSTLNLVEKCPYVNEVLSCGWLGDRDIHRFQRHWRAWKMARKHLWPREFDLAILPRRDADQSHGTFLAYFSRTPLRVGYSDNMLDVKLLYFRNHDCLLTHAINDYGLKHEIEYNLEIIRFLGGGVQTDQMEIWINNEDKMYAKKLLSSQRISKDELLIAFGPCKWDPKRRWPLSHFVNLGLWLSKKYRAKIIVLGGKEDEFIGQQIQMELGDSVINTVGQTTLRQTCALLENCVLFVGNDSGPKHLAAAVGVPVIEISCHPLDGSPFHVDSPRRFGPWGASHRVLSPKTAIPPCSDACMAHEVHCIRGVTVEQLKEAIADILSSQCQSKV